MFNNSPTNGWYNWVLFQHPEFAVLQSNRVIPSVHKDPYDNICMCKNSIQSTSIYIYLFVLFATYDVKATSIQKQMSFRLYQNFLSVGTSDLLQ